MTPSRTRCPHIRLRSAEAGDAASIYELETSCFDRAEEMFNRRQLQRLIANPRAIVVVAERKGTIMGWAAGLLRRDRHRCSGRLYAIAVHPDAQGMGIGKKLTDYILKTLTSHGAQRIFLEVHAENQKAINLYHKMGFIDRKYLTNYYGPHHHGIRMMRPATVTQRARD